MLSQLFVSTYLAVLNPIQITHFDVDLSPELHYFSESGTALSAEEAMTRLDRFTPCRRVIPILVYTPKSSGWRQRSKAACLSKNM